MKIKKLEIVGFKSFVDKSVLHFDHDVTGIVGPNGCGKSNVVDAIKWVMGEQSPSRLRGKAMDDVIFNGSESRGPHGFAEVSITFDNSDGLTPPEYRDYAEIRVTRRLDRTGRSDYLINKTPVRLMDVTNLFLGTGVGRRAYSIIEQGRIGFIVSSKPHDRRSMIEEAAGITKFKVRKAAAERKMEHTRSNLLRVGDILGELERSLASLKRQAQKAERYKKYRDEVRDLELWIASFRYLELFGETRVVRTRLDTETAASEGSRLAMRVKEAELEAERTEVERLGSEVEQSQNRAYELDNQVRLHEGQIQQQLDRLRALREREQLAERELGELVGQRDTLAQERDGLANALQALEAAEEEAQGLFERESKELERRRLAVAEAERAVSNARGRVGDAEKRIARAEAVLASFAKRREEGHQRLERMRAEKDQLAQRGEAQQAEAEELAARLEGLKSGKEQTSAKKAEIEQELRDLRDQIKGSDEEVERLREESATKRSRLRSLRELQEKLEGVGAGVRALMTRYAGDDEARRAKGVVGLVADRMHCPPELTEALAGALGTQLQEVVVERTADGLQALDWLRTEGLGRATLWPRRLRRVVQPRRAVTGDGVVGWLGDLVRSAPEDEALVRALIGDVLVVEDLDTALRLQRDGVDGRFVTRGGELITEAGSLTGGAGDENASHLLAMKREIRELEVVVAELTTTLGDAVQRHNDLRRGIAQRQAAIDAARTQAHDAEIAIVKADKDVRRLQAEAAESTRRSEVMGGEIDNLMQALSDASEEETAANEEIESAKKSRDEAAQELEAASQIHGERSTSVEEQSRAVTEVRVRAAQARERAESDRASLQRLGRSIDELDQREQRLRGDVEDGAREQGRLSAQLLFTREKLHLNVDSAMKAHEALGASRARHDSARHSLSDSEVTLKQLRSKLDSVAGIVNELTLRDRELSMELEHLLDQIEERHRVDLPKILTEYHARPLPDREQRERASELIRLIERMGEINLMAIEEYEEKADRFEKLNAQRVDLDDALKTLEKAIREMNRESRRMFKDAFIAVNERFKLLFPILFRGGKAELKLSDPNDLLNTGIEIIAQPPGKKLGSLELMSGGEKALTAVAMIFAIFQYKPSPFCLLDEVDAPLDEANIGRFAQAIRQMTDRSQFIVITHSKRTMEFTDVLYGVTMEEPGISKLVAVELRGENRPVAGDERTSRVA
ncbi:MAG: chromosome segregation protein SMC [Sandaracinus sp.]|nr:chromosome segregation protein SMC [Sandaracinus sp.]|tara:strand:+ start:1843 stop:5451 length:3609 start_codon:yes stop_codon:yes gene_type:complete